MGFSPSDVLIKALSRKIFGGSAKVTIEKDDMTYKHFMEVRYPTHDYLHTIQIPNLHSEISNLNRLDRDRRAQRYLDHLNKGLSVLCHKEIVNVYTVESFTRIINTRTYKSAEKK